MRMHRALRVVAATCCAGAVTLSVAACGGSKSDTAEDSARTGTTAMVSQLPAAGGGEIAHLNWALPAGEPASIDPTLGSDLSPTFVTSNLCDSLLKQNPDFSLAPNLATKFEQRDPKTLVYTIRQGVRFWDGRTMTAQDVAYSLQRAGRPESYVAVFFANVKSIRATGPYEVTVSFKRPDALFNMEMGGSPGTVIQKAYAEKVGKKLGSPNGGMMCTGPYELTRWKQGRSIELTRNDAYWDPALKARAKTVSVKFLADSAALAQALISGEVDGAYEIPPAILPSLQKAKSGTIHQGPSTEYLEFAALRAGGPLANAGVRDALLYSIDRSALARVVFHDTARPNYTMLATNSWPAEAKDLWQAAYGRWQSAHTLSVDQGKALVQKAGATGQTIKLATLSGDATQSQLAQLVQEQAQEVGLKVSILPLQPAQFSTLFVDPKTRENYDLALVTGFNGIPDPLELLNFEVTSTAFYNYQGYKNAQVDKLVAQATGTLDDQERNKLLIQAQDIYEKDFGTTSLLARNEVMFLNNRYSGAITSFAYLGRPALAYIGAAR